VLESFPLLIRELVAQGLAFGRDLQDRPPAVGLRGGSLQLTR